MKRNLTLVLVIALAFVLIALAGCGQSDTQAASSGPMGDKQTSDGGSMGDTRVCFIDVGKGDCILLQSGGSAALIDTGYDSTSPDVLSYLDAHGITRLDWVVLTHYDRDHVEGLRAIGKALDIDKVYLPGYEGSDKNYQTAVSAVEDLKLNTQRVTEEQHLKLGNDDLGIFPSSVKYVPGSKEEEGNDNDLSLVATLTGNGASYLFAGDLEEEGIAAYLKGHHGHFDVLKMPHHGKKSAGTEKLLEDVKPQIAIITDSKDKPADKKTLKLLETIGADVHRTGASGTIVVRSDSAGRYSVSG